MAEDINSIQDNNEQAGVKSKDSSIQKILAIFQSLLKHPLLAKIKQDKKLFFGAIGGGALVLLLLIVGIVVALTSNSKSKDDTSSQSNQSQVVSQDEIQKILNVTLPSPSEDNLNRSSVDNLIIKGNLLYNQGYHQEAFEVFKKIADFSQSIATYNLGTIQLESNLYEDSIASYADSIQTGQNVSVSSINAAVASLKLHRFDLYSYYLNVANNNLQEGLNEPFYSYTYALLSYYRDRYFETLSPLLNPSSKDFSSQNARLAAQIFTIFGDDVNALKSLQEAANPNDYKSMGLLYARIGDYSRAKGYLSRYLQNHRNDIESIMASQIIDLKLGNYSFAAANLDSISNDKRKFEIAKKTYPIKVIINPELFDVNIAQKSFWERDFDNKDKLGYKVLFYFAPYRVFDAKRALEEISQATNVAHINIQEGKNVLLRSTTTSKIDKAIIDSLVRIETKDLRNAYKFLKNATTNNPNHAILYYDLGLVCAQLGYYDEAYTHFIRAYYLDQSDYLSGIFAVLSGRFSYKDTERIAADMFRDFHDEDFDSQTQREFINNFLNYIGNNQIQDSDWIQKTQAKEPIFYALDFVYALRVKNKQIMLNDITALEKIYPRDIVVNILHALAKGFGDNLQTITFNIYNLFDSNTFDLNPVYYGGALPRELYVYAGFMSGSLQNQAKTIQDHLIAYGDNVQGTLQTLGLIYIYQKEFQKAYSIYNTLLDELKENDGHTRFLTAVSAVGAGNYGDAVLLLQLAKMETPTIYEARYALGLLYQAAQNFKAAASNYNFISPAYFKSEFFDFQIDTQKIYSYELENQKQQNTQEQAQVESNKS